MKPTREQIEQATEKEVREMIAQMLGWERTGSWVTQDSIGSSARLWLSPGDGYPQPLPDWSTNITHAYPIAERYRMALIHSEDGCYAIVPQDIEHGDTWYDGRVPELTVVGYPTPGDRFHPEPTMPLAICKTALYRWIEQPESES